MSHLTSRDSELTISSTNLPAVPLPTSVTDGLKTPTRRGPPLPPGCSYGRLTRDQAVNLPADSSDDSGGEKDSAGRSVIWVDFEPNSTENPFFFSKTRKRAILTVAIFFTGMTALNASAYSIGEQSMSRDLGLNDAAASSGLALYAWGFAIAPLALAPLSEEFGRRWTCIISVFLFWQCHLFMCLGKNLATVAVGQLLRGAAGSVGSTLVGGCISDIYIPSERGTPMAAFGAVAIGATGLGPVLFSWVEANQKLEWRWIQWIQYIILGAYFPFMCFIMRETRATVILRRKAAKYRKTQTGFSARFTARSEIEKVKFSIALRESLLRPITFLVVEPVVTFFSLWVGLCWGVFYIQISGLPYLYQNIFGFSITGVGLMYLSMVIGAILGFLLNYVNEHLYHRHKDKHGVEARLYIPMAAGVFFAFGCLIFAFTSVPGVHWMGSAVGAAIIIMGMLTIYICNFTYLSECYGSYASSAIAAQSFTRNIFGGAFTFLTQPLFDNLTVRWGTFVFACISGVLAVVPFIAYRWGPQIRARSKYSKQLMAEEARRIEIEKNGGDDAGDGALEQGVGCEGTPLSERVRSREAAHAPWDDAQVMRTLEMERDELEHRQQAGRW